MDLHPSADENDRLVRWQSGSVPAFRSCTPLASDHPYSRLPRPTASVREVVEYARIEQ